MEYGKVVDYIRRTKNITVKEICSDILTRQTYYRFVHNNVEISYIKLLHILKVLNINTDEFLFIANNFKQSDEFIIMDEIRKSFETKNIHSLENILKTYSKSDLSQGDRLLKSLTSILLTKLNDQHDEKSESTIRDYLFNIETWTHYETVLFNNSMFIFDNEFIELIFSKSIITLTQYSTLRNYGSESCRMYINIIILFIDRGEIEKARIMLKKVKENNIQDDWLYEKLSIKFITEIINYLNSGKKLIHFNECKKIILVLENLDANNSAKMFNSYLNKFAT